jgi:hypothetical protein
MQQGRASSRRTIRLACKPTRVTCRLRLYSDGRRSRAGRLPDPGERSGPDAAFAIFLTRFANQVHKVFFGPLPMRHTPLASPGVPKISSQRTNSAHV